MWLSKGKVLLVKLCAERQYFRSETGGIGALCAKCPEGEGTLWMQQTQCTSCEAMFKDPDVYDRYAVKVIEKVCMKQTSKQASGSDRNSNNQAIIEKVTAGSVAALSIIAIITAAIGTVLLSVGLLFYTSTIGEESRKEDYKSSLLLLSWHQEASFTKESDNF